MHMQMYKSISVLESDLNARLGRGSTQTALIVGK